MCEEHKFGGLWDDPERLERYQKLFEEAFPGKTALDILHRRPAKHAKKMKAERELDKITCGKCKQEMKEVELNEYEFEDGIVLENVKAMHCPKGHVTFTEDQALLMEQRTDDLKKHAFRFIRSVSKSARSLVIRIPSDLAKNIGLSENSKVEMIPIGKKRFGRGKIRRGH